jgi:hypothetical protein
VQIIQFIVPSQLHQMACDHFGECRLPEIEEARARRIEQPVKDYEGLAVGHIIASKRPVLRKASSQPPCDEKRLADLVKVREPAAVGGHKRECALRSQILTGIRKRG